MLWLFLSIFPETPALHLTFCSEPVDKWKSLEMDCEAQRSTFSSANFGQRQGNPKKNVEQIFHKNLEINEESHASNCGDLIGRLYLDIVRYDLINGRYPPLPRPWESTKDRKAIWS